MKKTENQSMETTISLLYYEASVLTTQPKFDFQKTLFVTASINILINLNTNITKYQYTF